jgi:hypothetical protein
MSTIEQGASVGGESTTDHVLVLMAPVAIVEQQGAADGLEAHGRIARLVCAICFLVGGWRSWQHVSETMSFMLWQTKAVCRQPP